MARHSLTASLQCYWLLLLLVLCSVGSMVPHVGAGFDCEASFVGGGCPSEIACAETCSHCDLKWGKVESYCFKDLGVIYWRCVCGFKYGAPCPPFDGCRPPRPPATMTTNITNPNVTTDAFHNLIPNHVVDKLPPIYSSSGLIILFCFLFCFIS